MRNSFRSAVLMLGVFIAGCQDCGRPLVSNDGGEDGGGAGGIGGGDGNDDGGIGGGTGMGGGGGGNMMTGDGGCGLVTCATSGANCGPIGDGCGALINCGSCTLPATCGGGAVPSVCGGDAGCIPTTCAALRVECGPMADRCGALMNCGACALPEICGGGGVAGTCGLLGSNLNDAGMCVPTTCAIAGAACGVIGDGCGNTLTCGSCPTGKLCGGGGVPYQCGGGAMCTPLTCITANANCGAVGDGCGGILNCGTCAAPTVCGGGGVSSRCGGGVTCVPKNCAQAGATCGVVGDGCGAVTASCGTCTLPQACGAGGVPNQCGGQVACVAKNCGQLAVNCGPVSDGCGSIIMCGNCTVAGQTCGGGGQANICGAPPPCVPRTCAQQGANCGQVGNGCGGLTADCSPSGAPPGGCAPPDICGGAGIPSVCGSVGVDAGTCTNLCLNQAPCSGVDGGTTFTGVVFAPTQADAGYGQPDPVPGALIYVPNSAVGSLSGDGGVTCDQCADGVSGSPLVSTYSATNGSFTLKNVPCGAGVQVPVVIQLGKWRRQITVNAPSCCVPTALTQDQTRLPRKQAEFHPNDNLPKIAVVTGSVDTIECVLPKIGIALDQYSLPSGNGRVKFYRDNGATFTGGAPAAASLFDSLAEMRKYDMIILDCIGSEQTRSIARRANMEAFANAGGRIFASHFSYVWLYGRALDPNANNIANNISFTSTATFAVNQAAPANQDALIDTSFPKGVTFAEWVQLVNAQAASSTPAVPRIRVNTVRHDLDAVIPPAQRWVYGTAGTTSGVPFQYTFNTPTNATSANQCGRVLFSDFHVIDASAGGATWPNQCSVGPMTPQEKVFEYLIFDLSSCITPDVPPPQMCTGRTCDQLGFSCGPAADGCGRTINCGACTLPATCGGGGVPYSCGTPCTPRTCTQLGANCGSQGDGCGGTINCGTCMAPQSCGGGGTPNVCGGGACVPLTCARLGYTCGSFGDGCGQTLNCGPCTAPQTCGGGGTVGQCGGGTCTTVTCATQGFNCGNQTDGCNGSHNCGVCTAPQTCGGGGQPGVCGGGGTCTARTCLMQGFNCGLQGDGCGMQINCGTCPPGQICGAQGPGLCGAAQCTPLTCGGQGIQCGPAGDGCGNIIQCGACPAGQACGGAGVPGVCGNRPCTPRTCSQIGPPPGANCGLVGDGCGGTLNCGICPPQESCGGGGVANVCGGLG